MSYCPECDGVKRKITILDNLTEKDVKSFCNILSMETQGYLKHYASDIPDSTYLLLTQLRPQVKQPPVKKAPHQISNERSGQDEESSSSYQSSPGLSTRDELLKMLKPLSEQHRHEDVGDADKAQVILEAMDEAHLTAAIFKNAEPKITELVYFLKRCHDRHYRVILEKIAPVLESFVIPFNKLEDLLQNYRFNYYQSDAILKGLPLNVLTKLLSDPAQSSAGFVTKLKTILSQERTHVLLQTMTSSLLETIIFNNNPPSVVRLVEFLEGIHSRYYPDILAKIEPLLKQLLSTTNDFEKWILYYNYNKNFYSSQKDLSQEQIMAIANVLPLSIVNQILPGTMKQKEAFVRKQDTYYSSVTYKVWLALLTRVRLFERSQNHSRYAGVSQIMFHRNATQRDQVLTTYQSIITALTSGAPAEYLAQLAIHVETLKALGTLQELKSVLGQDFTRLKK